MTTEERWRLLKAGIFVLIGLGAVGWLVVDQRRASAQQELPKTGVAVQGKLTDLESRRGNEQLTISYGYTVDGRAYEVKKRRVGDFDGLAPMGPITVWVDPADPRRCITANELRHSRFSATPWLFGAVIVLMMGLAARQARRAAQPDPEPVD